MAGITLSTSAITIVENGGTDTFSLTSQPKGIGMANTASGKRASRRR